MRKVSIGRRGGVGHVTALLLGLVLLCLLADGLNAPRQVSASPESQLMFSPTQGAVGTAVTVTLVAQLDSVGQTYSLGASMTDQPTNDTCGPNTIQAIPGVSPFVIAAPSGGQPAGATIKFSWPSSLDHGPYSLCAYPTASSGIEYTSTESFIVIGAVPTATALPLASAVVNASLSGAKVGAKFTVTVSHWSRVSASPPQSVILTTTPSPSGTSITPNSTTLDGTKATFTTAPGPTPGDDYTLTVTVPKVDPTVYYVAVGTSQGAYVYGGVLSVAAPVAPVSTPAAVPSTPQSTPSGSSPSLLVVGILLAIILIMLAAVLLRLRLRRQRAAQLMRERAAREQRDRHMRDPRFRQQQFSQQQFSQQQPYGQQLPRDQWGRDQQQPRQQPWGQPQPTREEWARTQRPPRDPRYPRQ